MDANEQQQLESGTGLTLELASQALAATGSKSTLKATEWILSQKRSLEVARLGKNLLTTGSQATLEQFFLTGVNSKALKTDAAEDGGAARKLSNETSAESQEHGESDGGGSVQVVGSASGGGGSQRAEMVNNVSPTPGWKSISASSRASERGEDVASAAPGAGKSSELWYNMVKMGPKGVGTGEEEMGNPSKQKRGMVSGTGSGPGPKRFKQLGADGAESDKVDVNQNALFNASRPGRIGVAPLAERMRPSTIDEVIGQDHLLGPRQILRTVLENNTVPSIIFWGPPGTGKTSLARAIARTLSGLRFVSLSAVHSGTKEIREVLEEAGKRAKRFGQRTLLFLDEVHRFNKAQQDLFLPSVEAGDVIFIGATTENPSFEINSALLSRCRVLTLLKLEPGDLLKLLQRAVGDREQGVFATAPYENFQTLGGECTMAVEEDALTLLASAADGDARVALNAIEMATNAAYSEARTRSKQQNQDVPAIVAMPSNLSIVGLERAGSMGAKRLGALIETVKENANSPEDYTKPFKRFVGGKEVTQAHNLTRFDRDAAYKGGAGNGTKDAVPLRVVESTGEVTGSKGSPSDALVPEGGNVEASGTTVLVTLAMVQEAFQRSHVLYDKTGEEHYNVISALHKSMRGGDPDAAIYWLARMLEGGEGPLYVARRLIRFASEDVGLADPHAMGIAVSCYQACHFLGMPECNVNLAQCVVYLAFAPKSVMVYEAIEAAQKLIRETQQNEPVPLHIRNAPTRLMKDMGYGKGYIYPPAQSEAVEQDYMPPSLRGHKFLTWPER